MSERRPKPLTVATRDMSPRERVARSICVKAFGYQPVAHFLWMGKPETTEKWKDFLLLADAALAGMTTPLTDFEKYE